MIKKYSWILPLILGVLIAGWTFQQTITPHAPPGIAFAQANDCVFSVVATGDFTPATGVANLSGNNPCVNWRVTFSTTGTLSTTVTFQTSPDNSSWTTVPNSICSSTVQPNCVFQGASPITAGTQGMSLYAAYGTYVRTITSSSSGAGTVTIRVYGAKGATASAGSSIGGGGGTGTVTSVATGCGLSGGTITTTGTLIRSEAVNTQTGSSPYAIANSDCGKYIERLQSGAVLDTIAQAGSGGNFAASWFTDYECLGAGGCTITPATSTIDGAASIVFTTNQGVRIVSNGTNYFTIRGLAPAGGGGVTSVATTCGTSGGTITTTGTISGSETVNAQAGSSPYAILNGDCGKLISRNQSAAVSDTIAQAGSGGNFVSGYYFDYQCVGAGGCTITPTTSTVDGASSLVLTQSQGVRIASNGTNYFTQRGAGPAGPTGPTGPTGPAGSGTGGLSNPLIQNASAELAVITTKQNITSGNLIIVGFCYAPGTHTPSCTDTLSTSYTRQIVTQAASGIDASILSGVAASSGADVITCVDTGGTFPSIAYQEVTGFAGTIDGTGGTSTVAANSQYNQSIAVGTASDYVYSIACGNQSGSFHLPLSHMKQTAQNTGTGLSISDSVFIAGLARTYLETWYSSDTGPAYAIAAYK